ncbi:unnamed protein product [Prorocentrum cordatum]|uniref:Uncharacterized protein n=1 Tax=Prorocentrum cordatum TaxID=2364126 RepID=A0ABN9SGK9_9DINO|nr:unnamed protein product [Polarella glacialis]
MAVLPSKKVRLVAAFRSGASPECPDSLGGGRLRARHVPRVGLQLGSASERPPPLWRGEEEEEEEEPPRAGPPRAGRSQSSCPRGASGCAW